MSKPKKTDEEIFYVYVYLDPRKPGKYSYCNGNINFEYEPFYVGKGSGNRYFYHIEEASRYKDKRAMNKHKLNRIRKIKRQTNNNPIIIFYERHLSDHISQHLECLLIAKIGRSDKGAGPLTNLTDGGEGNSGWIASESNRLKHSIDSLNRWKDPYFRERLEKYHREYHRGFVGPNLGRCWSQEYKDKMSNIVKGDGNGMYGKLHTDETKKKISDSRKGKRLTQEEKDLRYKKMQARFPEKYKR